ncbi:MAG: PspC domain-containing protein [Bacteroidia bacterium]
MITSIKINLNKTTFTLNNDAYHQLNNYVSALKNSFKSEPDILFDIEARIAELLTLQLAATQAEMVEANHVNEVIKTLGTVEELTNSHKSEKSYSNHEPNQSDFTNINSSKPKLRRNPFNQSLGGVCSGIANYLSVDTSFIRIAFVFAFFFFGTGILAYIVLWVVIPKATGEDADKIIKNENNNVHKLYRNKETKAIGGVCSGLALHFGIEIWVVRLAFFAGLFFWGTSFLIYMIAWITIPEANNQFQKTKLNNNQNYVVQNDTQLNGIRSFFKFIIALIAIFLLGILVISFFFTAGMFSFFTNINLFDFLSNTVPFDENLSILLTGVLLIIFAPVLFLLAVIAKYAFKANIQFRYAGFGLVFLFFLGIGLLIYVGVNMGANYFQAVDNTDIENENLPQNDSLIVIINELSTGKQIDFFSKNEFKIQLCDSGIFVPINYEIDNTLENKSTYTINKQFKGVMVSKTKAKLAQIVLQYKLVGDSIIFPSHYFIPKLYKFKFQTVKVKFYLKENVKFYANETAQKVFGFIGKRETPTQFWFKINNINSYKNEDSNQSRFERKQEEIERKIEEKQTEIERKLEEKEAELERKADNL